MGECVFAQLNRNDMKLDVNNFDNYTADEYRDNLLATVFY